MVEIVAGIVVATAGAVGTFVGLYRAKLATIRAIDTAWAQVARELGGTFTPATGNVERRILATVAGCALQVDHYEVNEGDGHSKVYTRLFAESPLAAWAGLSLSAQRGLRSLAVYLGRQDIQLGIAEFDRDWVIQGSEPELVRELLDEPAREAVGHLPGASSNGAGQLVIVWRGIERDPEVIAARARHLAVLAGCGPRLVARWDAVAAALGLVIEHGDKGMPTLRGQLGDRPLEIVTRPRERVSIKERPATTLLTLGLRRNSSAPLELREAGEDVPESLRELFLAAAPYRARRRDDRVQVVLHGVGPDLPALRRGLALAQAMCDDVEAVYR